MILLIVLPRQYGAIIMFLFSRNTFIRCSWRSRLFFFICISIYTVDFILHFHSFLQSPFFHDLNQILKPHSLSAFSFIACFKALLPSPPFLSRVYFFRFMFIFWKEPITPAMFYLKFFFLRESLQIYFLFWDFFLRKKNFEGMVVVCCRLWNQFEIDFGGVYVKGDLNRWEIFFMVGIFFFLLLRWKSLGHR